MRRLKIFMLLAASTWGVASVTGCAEAVGTGAPVRIPTVIVDCTTPNCRSNTQQNVFVYITRYSCSNDTIGRSEAVTSATITCNPSTGCRTVLNGPWTGGDLQSTTTVPSASYTVCAHLDANGNFPTTPGYDDTTLEIQSLSFVDGMGVISLGGAGSLGSWSDH